MWLTSSKPLMLAENTAVVAVPNEFTRNQLEGRLRTRIEDTLSERLGKPVRLAVSVDPTLETDAPDAPGQPPGLTHGDHGSDRPARTPTAPSSPRPTTTTRGPPHQMTYSHSSTSRQSDLSTKMV